MSRKLLISLVINIEIMAIIFFLMFVAQPEVLIPNFGLLLGALIATGGVYITGNVVHAWQKSANFQPELKEKKGPD